MIQEWWGLTSHIANVANRLAAAGFVADGNLLSTYDPEQAAKAWDATVRFLRTNLARPSTGTQHGVPAE